MWRSRILVLASVALLLPLPTAAAGQAADGRRTPGDDARGYLDYYVSRYRLEGSPVGSTADAVGGRLTWAVAPLLGTPARPWLARALVGGYLAHTPEDGDRPEMWRYGAQLDYRLTRAPLAGRLEPLVSLGVGAVRVTEPGMAWSSAPYLILGGGGAGRGVDPPLLAASLPGRSSTSPSLTPGVGARLRVARGLSLRADARRVIDFRDGVVGDFELSGGLSVGR